MTTTNFALRNHQKMCQAARFCQKARHEIREIQAACSCPSTRKSFERSIDALERIIELLGRQPQLCATEGPPITYPLDVHDSLVLLSHYLRCVLNALNPLAAFPGETPGWTDEKIQELRDLITIIHLDCENACIRATLAVSNRSLQHADTPSFHHSGQ